MSAPAARLYRPGWNTECKLRFRRGSGCWPAHTRNHFFPLWEKTLSDERQFYDAPTAAPPGLDSVVTWGVPSNYFRRLLHSIFRAWRKNFNGTADICTFVGYGNALGPRNILAHAGISSPRIRVRSAFHLVDHNVPHVDIELELVL